MANNHKVLIDTDILIDHFKNINGATNYIHRILHLKTRPFLSIITRIELLSGSKVNEKEETIIKDLLNRFDIVILDEFLADLSATFRKKYNCGLPDSIIAASAFKEGATLVTRNIKHFEKIKEIKILSPYKL